MGGPMTYRRVIERNHLTGNYKAATALTEDQAKYLAGDLRRLEWDTLAEDNLERIAKELGLNEQKVFNVLRLFFVGDIYSPGPAWFTGKPGRVPKEAEASPDTVPDDTSDVAQS